MEKKIEIRVLEHIDANGPTSLTKLAEVVSAGIEEMNEILRDGVRLKFLGREYDKEQRCVVYTMLSRGRNSLSEHHRVEEETRNSPDVLLARIEELEVMLRAAQGALTASMQLSEELIAQGDEEGGVFMVSVDGAGAPRHIHKTENEARDEAMRLAALPGNADKTIRVLKLVDTLNVGTVRTATWSSDIEEGEAPGNCTEQCGQCAEAFRA